MQQIQNYQTQPKQTKTQRGFCCSSSVFFRRKTSSEKIGTGMTVGIKSKAKEEMEQKEQEQHQLCLLDFLLTALRKSMMYCRLFDEKEEVKSTVHSMEIGWPTNVQHLTHVTFDRFHGFLGLPVEFEVEIPCKAPSARFVLKNLLFYCFFFGATFKFRFS